MVKDSVIWWLLESICAYVSSVIEVELHGMDSRTGFTAV